MMMLLILQGRKPELREVNELALVTELSAGRPAESWLLDSDDWIPLCHCGQRFPGVPPGAGGGERAVP